MVSVFEPKEEKEEEAPAPDLSAIEVEKKGKEAKEGEGAEVGTTPGAAPTKDAKPTTKDATAGKETKGKWGS